MPAMSSQKEELVGANGDREQQPALTESLSGIRSKRPILRKRSSTSFNEADEEEWNQRMKTWEKKRQRLSGSDWDKSYREAVRNRLTGKKPWRTPISANKPSLYNGDPKAKSPNGNKSRTSSTGFQASPLSGCTDLAPICPDVQQKGNFDSRKPKEVGTLSLDVIGLKRETSKMELDLTDVTNSNFTSQSRQSRDRQCASPESIKSYILKANLEDLEPEKGTDDFALTRTSSLILQDNSSPSSSRFLKTVLSPIPSEGECSKVGADVQSSDGQSTTEDATDSVQLSSKEQAERCTDERKINVTAPNLGNCDEYVVSPKQAEIFPGEREHRINATKLENVDESVVSPKQADKCPGERKIRTTVNKREIVDNSVVPPKHTKNCPDKSPTLKPENIDRSVVSSKQEEKFPGEKGIRTTVINLESIDKSVISSQHAKKCPAEKKVCTTKLEIEAVIKPSQDGDFLSRSQQTTKEQRSGNIEGDQIKRGIEEHELKTGADKKESKMYTKHPNRGFADQKNNDPTEHRSPIEIIEVSVPMKQQPQDKSYGDKDCKSVCSRSTNPARDCKSMCLHSSIPSRETGSCTGGNNITRKSEFVLTDRKLVPVSKSNGGDSPNPVNHGSAVNDLQARELREGWATSKCHITINRKTTEEDGKLLEIQYNTSSMTTAVPSKERDFHAIFSTPDAEIFRSRKKPQLQPVFMRNVLEDGTPGSVVEVGTKEPLELLAESRSLSEESFMIPDDSQETLSSDSETWYKEFRHPVMSSEECVVDREDCYREVIIDRSGCRSFYEGPCLALTQEKYCVRSYEVCHDTSKCSLENSKKRKRLIHAEKRRPQFFSVGSCHCAD